MVERYYVNDLHVVYWSNNFKWAIPGLFFIYICLFKPTLQFLQQIHVKKCPSSIWCRELNPQPSKDESPPITTRPGHPPNWSNGLWTMVIKQQKTTN